MKRALLFCLALFSLLFTVSCSESEDNTTGSLIDTIAAPIGLTAAAADKQVTLNWQPVVGAANYTVYWGTTPGVTVNSQNIPNITTTTYTHTALTNGTPYYYAVVAKKATGTMSKLSAPEVSATPNAAVIQPPLTVTATAGNKKNSVTWTAVAGATSYILYYGTTPVTASSTSIPVTGTTYEHMNLTNGTTYYYKVVTVKGADKSVLSTQAMATPNFLSDTLTDASVNAGETLHLINGNEYILKGFVFVETGATIKIDSGVVIKGMPGEGADASALIICRGGKIMAEGTKTAPIIFTAASDDLSTTTDLTATDRGKWGGLIVLGNAKTNFVNNGGGTGQIEGIPNNEPRGQYGGIVDDDNSGVIKYVSIRHGGTLIGADNEINGLTLGAVGSKTVIEYVEVFANVDDGVEFFGGTVNAKYISVSFCGDDSYDYDEGFRGKGQFWFTLQGDDAGNMGGEHDGGPKINETGTPYANPNIYNATYLGSPVNAKSAGIIFRDNAAGRYSNSIFGDFKGTAIKVEDLAGEGDSRARLESGDLKLSHNLFFKFGGGATLAELVAYDPGSGHTVVNPTAIVDSMTAWQNKVIDPALGGISRVPNKGLDPLPAAGGAAYTAPLAAYPAGDAFYTPVNYRGAFGADNWLKGWTALDQYGFVK